MRVLGEVFAVCQSWSLELRDEGLIEGLVWHATTLLGTCPNPAATPKLMVSTCTPSGSTSSSSALAMEPLTFNRKPRTIRDEYGYGAHCNSVRIAHPPLAYQRTEKRKLPKPSLVAVG